ncbi:hypothetical protein HMN09_00998800 [Mycena chlorophos]|uniref:Uncharacterized protein n=1 Tax=Mycena chlorophos TaxID=658473 RepID=A0A8H6VZX6_MYCCL|nr:hypothetical protein HMN09_00998800 [Mycena chlorophos]
MAQSAAKRAAFALPKSVVERNSKTKKASKKATSSKPAQPAQPNSEDELPPTITLVGTMEMRKKRAEHPGGPDMARPKRSPAEVTAQKRAVATQKAAAAQKLSDGIDAIAKIEQQSLRKQDTKTKSAANPPPAPTKRKARPVAPAREPSPSFDDVPQPKFGDGDIDMASSDSDAYEQEAEEEESDSEMDVVSEEEQQQQPKRGKGTKKATKNAVRHAVEQVREKLEPKVTKRKASGAVTDEEENTSKVKTKTKKARPTQPHGIRKGFVLRTSSTVPASDATFDHNDSSDGEAAFSDDGDDGEEGAAAARSPGKASAVKRMSLAGVVPTAEPDYVDPDSDTGHAATAKFKVGDVRKKDLDPETREKFNDQFAPSYLSYIGEQRAWTGVDDDSAPVALFNSLFPKIQVTIYGNDGRTIVQLTKKEYSNLVHAIAAGAGRLIRDEMAGKSAEQIKAHVAAMMEGDDTQRVFYWRVWKDGRGEGFLQSAIILRVLAIFIAATSCSDEPGPIGFNYQQPQTYPIKRAYNAYLTGEFKAPAAFSKANFEDRLINVVDGVNKPTFGTSGLDNMLRSVVTGKQWRRIVDAARQAAKSPQEKRVVYDIDAMTAPVANYSAIVDHDPDTDEEPEVSSAGSAALTA